MGGKNKKRKREDERPTIHPNNKYAENPPDFAHLASLYPSFQSFVQYSRYGNPRIDWSFLHTVQQKSLVSLPNKNTMSFMLEGLQRQHGGFNVLENVKSYFSSHGLSCTMNTSSFTVDVVATKDDCESILKNKLPIINQSIDYQPTEKIVKGSSANLSCDRSGLRISVCLRSLPGGPKLQDSENRGTKTAI